MSTEGEGRKERKTAEGKKKDTQVMFAQDILSPYLENLTGFYENALS